jgi:molybdenum cofactor guanylyltransferase
MTPPRNLGGRPSAGYELPAFEAIVLTGGRARRLGGAYKPAIVVGDRPIAARVVGAVGRARRVILVGPPVPGVRVDAVTCETPPGGGPAAAIDAGQSQVSAGVVVVLAGDLPFLTSWVVDELRDALDSDPTAAAALLVDDAGRDQPLCSAWRTELLRDALATLGEPVEGGRSLAGVSLRDLLEAAEPLVRRAVRAGSGPPPWFDCDTAEDLARAREWA